MNGLEFLFPPKNPQYILVFARLKQILLLDRVCLHQDFPKGSFVSRSITLMMTMILVCGLAPLIIGQGCRLGGSQVMDTDRDGYSDEDELAHSPPTDPNDPDDYPGNVKDSDADGFGDYEEINGTPGTDPYDREDNPAQVKDSDGDGCSDWDELNRENACDNNPFTDINPAGHTVTVRGTLSVPDTLLIDGDTNDPNNPLISNDTIAEAQAVPNPCTIGGYLGPLQTYTDTRDVYLVQMAAGQIATLLLADPSTNDFDLYLYAETGGDPLVSSEGYGQAEQVAAPENGTFLIVVYGYSIEYGQRYRGGGLYTLLVGEDVQVPTSPLSTLHNFVEGEIIAKRKAGVSKTDRARKNAALGLERMNATDHPLGFERLRLTTAAKAARVAARTNKTIANGLRIPQSPTIAAIKALAYEEDIEYAEPNYLRQPSLIPNDEFYRYQWHYEQIALPQAWDITTGSSDIIVAVIDTGVVLNHPDLQGQLTAGYDFISDLSMSADGDGIDSNPDDPGDSDNPFIPHSYHGTHVAGTIAARTNNNRGVAGIAWNTRIMPVRALGIGGGTDYDISQGILYAAGLPNDSGTVPTKKADIINMSLGGPGYSRIEQEAITAARQAGVIIITAAGNRSVNGDDDTPGGLDGVFNVSAVGYTRQRAPYSNFGQKVALCAPGGDITADRNGDGFADGVLSTVGKRGNDTWYEFYEGTSMAAPHVSGVVALMKAVHPSLGPTDLEQLLAGTHPGTALPIVDDLGATGKDVFYGYGLINALAAVRAAAEISNTPPSNTPVLRIVPSSLDFGERLTTLPLTAVNGGGGTLSISNITTSDDWMAVTSTDNSENGGSYTVSVQRGGLADGTYSGSITFASNGGDVSVSVRMSVGAAATGGDVGTLYVLLVDPQNSNTVVQAETTAAEGYAFTLENVPAGNYLLYAGTDMDDNLFIGEQGEAFGGYPVLSYLETVTAQEDLDDRSFSVNYFINLQTPAQTGVSGNARPQTSRETVIQRIR